MPRPYNTILRDMQHAILAGAAAGAVTHYPPKPGFSPEEQIGVYIHAYRIRLREVLARNFPAARACLGDEWDRLASSFIESTPSTEYNLDRYPLRLPEYLDAHCADAFARELARLEGDVLAVYLAEDSPALDPTWLAAQAPETLEDLHLHPRKALRARKFGWPVHEYLAAFRASGTAEKPAPAPQHLVICRHNNTVQRHIAAPDEFAAFITITAGATLGETLHTLETHHAFPQETIVPQLQGWFSRWLREGWLRQP